MGAGRGLSQMETIMHHKLRAGSLRSAGIALALVAGLTTVTAAETNQPPEKLALTSAQKQKIGQSLANEHAQLAPPDFKIAVGAKLPASVSLSPVPLAVSNDIPATKNLSYARLDNKDIVLVDPKDRAVAEVIDPRPSTTGSSQSN